MVASRPKILIDCTPAIEGSTARGIHPPGVAKPAPSCGMGSGEEPVESRLPGSLRDW
jgi:hypothetical protein